MKVQIVSKTGTGSSDSIVMNTNATPFNVGFGVIVTGTVNYTVQHTFDDPASGFSVWFDHPTIASQAAKDRKSTRLNSSHSQQSRMPSSA